ncbi:MAG: O-antigen/teichoic acid export membrane protein [Candidatus Krumholzibacteriia bacterium]|jgi:O-antigen/teichoic acid export membrane protein
MKLFNAGGKILFSRVGQVMANAAVVMVVANVLGPEKQGHFSLTVAVAMLVAALLGGGMGLASVPPLRQGKVKFTRMFTAQVIWMTAMVAVIGVVAWLTNFGRFATGLNHHLGWSLGMGYIAAVAAVGMLGFETFSYDLLARGRLVVGAAVNGVRALGHLALVGVLALLGALTFERTVGAFALAQFGGAMAMLVILLRELKRSYRDVVLPAEAPALPLHKDDVPDDLNERSYFGLIVYNLRHGWLGQISAVAYFLLLRLDQGLLEHFRGSTEVGIYSVAVYLGEMLWLLPGALTPLLVHSSAGNSSDPERDRTAARALRLGTLVTLLAGLPLLFLIDPVLSVFAGGQYVQAGPAFKALLPGIVIFAPGAVLAGDFIGRGKPHWNTQASGLTVLVNVVVGVQLIPEYGALGAAWSSTIAYACGSFVMLARFRRVTKMSLRGLVLGQHQRMIVDRKEGGSEND